MNQDEELQKKMEEGYSEADHSADAEAYREVFQRLRQKPEVLLSDGFADRIVVQVLEKKRRRIVNEYIWFSIGILFLVVAFIVAVVVSEFRVDLGFLKGISPYAGIFIFGIVFIIFLNRLDKKLMVGKKE